MLEKRQNKENKLCIYWSFMIFSCFVKKYLLVWSWAWQLQPIPFKCIQGKVSLRNQKYSSSRITLIYQNTKSCWKIIEDKNNKGSWERSSSVDVWWQVSSFEFQYKLDSSHSHFCEGTILFLFEKMCLITSPFIRIQELKVKVNGNKFFYPNTYNAVVTSLKSFFQDCSSALSELFRFPLKQPFTPDEQTRTRILAKI